MCKSAFFYVLLQRMKFVDVILPLGFEGLFTYSVPERLQNEIKPLVRVIVPLGKSKTYSGITAKVHDIEPQGVEIKEVIDIVDKQPIMLPYQYNIWQWIAEYYMCPIGDVMRAAFPAGMKQENGYKPKTETYIRLTERYRNEQALHVALDILKRAVKQQEVLTTYLFLSHFDSIEGVTPTQEIEEITREELTNTAKCTAAHVKALIDRGFLETYEVEVGRLNTNGKPHPENIKPLNEAQEKAFKGIIAPQGELLKDASSTDNTPDNRPTTNCSSTGKTIQKNSPRGGWGACTTLLHGVTGSGKTEIYIHLIQKYIDEGKQVLYLLPEIALTVQIMQRLHRVFGDRLGIYHSKYSDAERVEIWQKQLSDKPYDVILGARSAVFLPLQRLGLIIIDEEHEQSFKQQDPAPRYHARSVALMLARQFPGTQVVLGTATPSMETFHNAMTEKFRYIQLTERYKGMELPKVDIINTAELQHRKLMQGPFSPQLIEAIKEAITNGKQVILFQNRRGFAPMVECHECGWIPKCKNCDVTLTMHKVTSQLTCHYCGFTYPIPPKCPNCFTTDIRQRGYGTEKVEELLPAVLNDIPLKIGRMDLDTTRTKNAYERLISDFSAGKTNILIGTQMVSKGLDFENVSVVGILNADTMLNYPDFRAYEHAFQMLCQVSGRAGRKGERGRVILQTKHPDLPVIDQVVRNDYSTFFREQSEERHLFHYPPFTRIINIYIRHSKEPLVDSAAIEMGSRLKQLFGSRILGPDRPAVSRVKQMNIRKIVMKLELGIDLPRVRQYLRQVRDELLKDKRYASMQVFFDVDPL